MGRTIRELKQATHFAERSKSDRDHNRKTAQTKTNSHSLKLAQTLMKSYNSIGLNGKTGRRNVEGKEGKYVADLLVNEFSDTVLKSKLGYYTKELGIENMHFYPDGDNTSVASQEVNYFREAMNALVAHAEERDNPSKPNKRIEQGNHAGEIMREFFGKVPADVRKVYRALDNASKKAVKQKDPRYNEAWFKRQINDLERATGVSYEQPKRRR